MLFLHCSEFPSLYVVRRSIGSCSSYDKVVREFYEHRFSLLKLSLCDADNKKKKFISPQPKWLVVFIDRNYWLTNKRYGKNISDHCLTMISNTRELVWFFLMELVFWSLFKFCDNLAIEPANKRWREKVTFETPYAKILFG